MGDLTFETLTRAVSGLRNFIRPSSFELQERESLCCVTSPVLLSAPTTAYEGNDMSLILQHACMFALLFRTLHFTKFFGGLEGQLHSQLSLGCYYSSVHATCSLGWYGLYKKYGMLSICREHHSLYVWRVEDWTKEPQIASPETPYMHPSSCSTAYIR